MNSAPAPEEKGEPLTVEMAPFEPTAKAETVPEPELLTNAKLMVCPEGMGERELFIIPQPMAKATAVAAPTKTQIDEEFLRGWPASKRPDEIIRSIS